ncbi:MAG: arginine repressor [bacterium]
MTKAKRQAKIMEIIKKKGVETQEELALDLEKEGMKVTQATISRDIKELRLIKIPAGGDRYKYALPYDKSVGNMYDVMGKIFKDFVVHIDYMEFFIVLKTLPGTANAIAASLDEANLPEVMGTIAGDDNVLIIIKPKDKVEELVQKFRKMMG